MLTIAEDQGFFEKQGINVRIRGYKSGGAGLDEMLAGNIHIAGVAETPIVYTSFARNDFQVFATVYTNSNDPKIIARSDKGVLKPSDLAGKRIGSTKNGQSAHFFLHLFMLKYGIEQKDVTVVHDSPAGIAERLNSGDIDAASLFEPYVTFAEKKLGDNARVFAEPGIYFKTFNLVSKTIFLKNNQEAVKRVLYALIRAEKFVLEQPGQTVEIISAAYFTDKEIVTKFLASSSLDVTLSGSLLTTMKDQARWAVENKLTDHREIPNYSDFVYTDALKSVRPESMTILR